MKRLFSRSAGWLLKAAGVTKETIRVLKAFDTLMLILTYLITRSFSSFLQSCQRLHWWILWGKIPDRLEPTTKPQGIVFLIPGYTNRRRSLLGMVKRLHKAGYITILADVGPVGNVHTKRELIHRNGKLLEETAQLALSTNMPIVFLGQSMGGCHAAWMAQELQDKWGVNTCLIVTVQSPINGSRVAHFGEFPGAAEIASGTDAVQETIQCFRHLELDGVSLKFFCAIYDEVVRKADSRLRKAPGCPIYWSESLPHIGHWGALQNPWAMDIILGYINHYIDSIADDTAPAS